jgi:hypothetical protein
MLRSSELLRHLVAWQVVTNVSEQILPPYSGLTFILLKFIDETLPSMVPPDLKKSFRRKEVFSI